MALMGRALFFLFVAQVVLVHSTTTISSNPDQSSPATFITGDDIILTCSSDLSNPSYTWSTGLTNGDGSSVDNGQTSITGVYLHGANAGVHTCSVMGGGNTETATYDISLEGTRVWYSFPAPGDVLHDNIAIAVHTTVNEIRCYSPDITTNNEYTTVTTPSGSNPLNFISNSPGKLLKTGGTSIGDIDVGVYTCRYSNNGITYEKNFAVYSRDREPENSDGTSLTISSVDYTITDSTMVVTCMSAGWPASNVKWIKNSKTLSSDNVYSFDQTVANRADSTYENTLTVSESSPAALLGDYSCEIDTVRHNGDIIDSTSGSVCVQSAGTLLMSVSTLEDPEIGQTYVLNCTVTIEGDEPVLTWKKNNTVLMNGSSSSISIGNTINNGQTVTSSLILGPLSQSHNGYYTCSAVEGSNTGIVGITIDVKIPLPVVTISPGHQTYNLLDQVELMCSVTIPNSLNMSGMITSITWFLGDTEVPSTNTSLGQGLSTLDLDRIFSAEAGRYTCKATIQSIYIDIDTNVSASDTANITVQLPTNDLHIFAPSPVSFPYYSGTQRGFTCQFEVNAKVFDDPNFYVTLTYRKGDDPVVFDDHLSHYIYVHLPGSNTFSATFFFSYLTLLDNGTYYCDATFGSTIENEFILPTFSIANLYINIKVPTPITVLTSSVSRIPNHSDYNDLILSCTATIPINPPIFKLQFDKVLTWKHDGVDVSSMAGTISSPSSKVSVGELNIEVTTAGDNVFECETSIDIPTDPLLTDSTTLTINVLGPAAPNSPISLESLDIQYNRATIQWTAPTLSYTPETYTVIYGTSETALTDTSAAVNGVQDFDSASETYSVTLNNLVYSTVYYYRVRATNTESSTDSDIAMFETKERPPTAPPTNFTLNVLNATAIEISWGLPPEDQRNGVITNYTLSCDEFVDGSSLLVTAIPFPLLITKNGSVVLVYDSFRPGTLVNCSVRASNLVGIGPPAFQSATTIEERPGGPPIDFAITYMTSRTFSLSWKAPDPYLQYGVITNYNVTCIETILKVIPSSYPKVYYSAPYPDSVMADGLRPDTQYSCSIVAINSAGSSVPVNDSTMTDEDVPDGTPNQFTVTTITSTSFVLTWRPIDTLKQNGEILNYTIDCNNTMMPLMIVSPDTVTEMSMDEYSQDITGFGPGVYYQCAIYANTTVGAGPPAFVMATTLEESPSSAPVNITIEASSRFSVIIRWLPPDTPNGIITQYTLYSTIICCNSNANIERVINNNGLEYEFSGLGPYHQLRVQLSASTAIGEGPRSIMEIGRSDEDVPDLVKGIQYSPLSQTSLSVGVPIHQDISVANGVITQYYSTIVRYDGTDSIQDSVYMTGLMDDSYCIDDNTINSVTGNDLHQFIFNNLVPQVPYNVTVNATNAAGSGDSLVSIQFSQEGLPPSPSNVTINRTSDTTIIVRWNLISIVEARGHLLGYIVAYSPEGDRKRQTGSASVGPDINEVTIDTLKGGVSYTVAVSAYTNSGDGEATVMTVSTYKEEVTEPGLNIIVIIVPIVLIVLLLAITGVVIAICLVQYKRLRTTHLKTDSSDFELGTYKANIDDPVKVELNGINNSPPTPPDNDYNVDPTAITLSDRLKPIPKSVFSQHVREMHKDRDRGFELEYQSLTNPTIIPHEAAEYPANRAKNRFANIKPFDFSRVVLKMLEGVDGSDYINASYMDGYNKRDSYIAAQGPITNTIVDFWRMVWEHKLDTIVMLTKCREGGKRKCEEYWPEKLHEPKDMGCSITVTLTSITPYADFEKKVFRVMKEDEQDSKPIDVIHWHFLGWPDHGVPLYATSLISFIRHVRKHRGKHGPPILTHCSAGVGRTGTYILLDSMLERLLVEDTINVYEFLRQMRSKRVFMVQTVQQYVFIHDALDELITCGDTDITVQTLKNKIEHMHKIIPGKGCSGFDSQFQLLGQVSRKPIEVDCTDALIDANRQKNRYPDRLPYNICRARLRLTGAPGSDYINASFVDGYKLRNAYIATQAPLFNTVHDFWRLIWEFKSKAIVQLCQLEENGIEVCYQYWPTRIGEPMQFNKLIVTLQSENKKLGYYIRKFEIKEDRPQPTSFVVTQYQYTEWPEHSCPVNYEDMLVLLEDLNKVQRSSGNKPITVMCNDGMGRSGTFICVHAQQDRMKTEAVVDIFHYIKSIRIQRAGLVADLEQFIFCHQTLTKFYGRFDSYSNFNC